MSRVMCLYRGEKRKLEEDTKCYKLLVFDDYTGAVVSPYMSKVYNPGDFAVAGEYEKPQKYTLHVVSKDIKEYYIIRGGFIHTFCGFRDILLAAERIMTNNLVFAECTIPKGSEIYEGLWEGNYVTCYSYASPTLHIDRFLTKDEVEKQCTKEISDGCTLPWAADSGGMERMKNRVLDKYYQPRKWVKKKEE